MCFCNCSTTIHLFSSPFVGHAGKWEVRWGLTCGGPCIASVSLPQTMLSLVNIGGDSEYFTTIPNPSQCLGPAPLIQPNMLPHDHFLLPFIPTYLEHTATVVCSDVAWTPHGRVPIPSSLILGYAYYMYLEGAVWSYCNQISSGYLLAFSLLVLLL